MEVVCLILGPSQPCLHAFWVLTSLHLSLLLKMFFIIIMARRAIPMITFPRVRCMFIYIYIYIYIYVCVTYASMHCIRS